MTDADPHRVGGAARLDATVHGRVQGVGFRYYVLRRAAELDLRGWVANEPDGSVRCVAEGTRPDLERLLADLTLGPPGAIVEDVRADWGLPSGSLPPFGIRAAAHGGD